ncbi:MAG TPA: TadE/TadG family type IV pilus assembly protein [Anaerolineales bacterium]|nr:TadE/TadG family type IV pilus assembly protein [Anaerolineales bacterium]
MKPIKRERGQSLVELGISLLILVYLLSGAVEFGVLFFQFVQLRDAAQEGALYGSTNPSNVNGITDRIKFSSNSPLKLDELVTSGDVTITISIDGIPSTDANYYTVDCENHGIQVVVGYDHRIFMPFMAALLGRSADPTIPLSASVTDTILTPVDCIP